MIRYNDPIKLGYETADLCIDPVVRPLVDETVDCYRRNHGNLQAVFVIGSITLGEWKAGVSDLDTIGVMGGAANANDEAARRQELVDVGSSSNEISFVDNTTFDSNMLQAANTDLSSAVAGSASKLALTGLCVWGDGIDFSPYLPSIGEMAYGRTDRVEALMHKYRSGNLIEPFRQDERLLIRSCGKAAMRVLSGTTLLRGADYHPSPYRTAEIVDTYTPEARALNSKVMDMIDDPIDRNVDEAIVLADSSVALFRRLFQPASA